MSEKHPGQFRRLLSDGMRIDRLPVGRSAGHHWINFIFSGVDFRGGREPRSNRMWDEFPDLLRLDGDGGRISLPATATGDSGLGGDIYWVHYESRNELRRPKVSYLNEGAVIASERLNLG